MSKHHVLLLLAFSILGTAAGCGGGGTHPDVVAAKGTVTLDGTAVSGVMLTFVPQEGVKGRGGVATTDSEGRFEAKAGGALLGMTPGKYRVLFEKHVSPDGTPIPPVELTAETPSQNQLAPIYSDPTASPVLVTVPEGGDESMRLEIQSSPRR